MNILLDNDAVAGPGFEQGSLNGGKGVGLVLLGGHIENSRRFAAGTGLRLGRAMIDRPQYSNQQDQEKDSGGDEIPEIRMPAELVHRRDVRAGTVNRRIGASGRIVGIGGQS